MNDFFIIITALTDSFAEILAGKLVSRGWIVSSASGLGGSFTTMHENAMGVVINLRIMKKTEPLLKGDNVDQKIQHIIKSLGMKYFSMVIVNFADRSMWWSLGNIDSQNTEQEPIINTMH
jgi:hypothetical protein